MRRLWSCSSMKSMILSVHYHPFSGFSLDKFCMFDSIF
uniref:Uncharacterized protein n=1 Tax=Arundo donax TaxID=35708 RepID=A0A0A8Z2P2_ARUDO